MLDIVSYLLGEKAGQKEMILDGDDVTLTYDEETKTVTLTKGGDENNG